MIYNIYASKLCRIHEILQSTEVFIKQMSMNRVQLTCHCWNFLIIIFFIVSILNMHWLFIEDTLEIHHLRGWDENKNLIMWFSLEVSKETQKTDRLGTFQTEMWIQTHCLAECRIWICCDATTYYNKLSTPKSRKNI